jgi:hypothetical protein
MNHADNLVLTAHGWAVGAWTILVMAAVLGLATNQTLQLISAHFQSGERSIASATSITPSAAKPVGARYDTPPIILTVPFAVTRTQQMMVARAKHRADFAHRVDRFRSGLKAAPGLIAGLALLGVSQSPSH